MRRTRKWFSIACAGLMVSATLIVAGPTAPAHAADPVRIIFDTDVEDDVDDAGAVATLHALADNGEAQILAMMVNTNSQWGAPALDAMNTWYGRPSVPIGTLKPTTDGTSSRYTRQIAQEFPNDLRTGHNAPDATTLYRQVLAAQPDGSVVIVSVGFLTNLANLLASGADGASPLGGRELVARKVRLLSAMAGAFPSGSEFNLNQRPSAAAAALNNWPGRAVFSGYEIGDSIYTGGALTQTPATNPIRRSYELYQGAGNNRSSWDQTSVYYAVRGTAGLFGHAGGTGSISVDAGNGSNYWNTSVDKDQNYLTMVVPDGTVARAIDALMLQPPRNGNPPPGFVLGVNLNGPAVTVDGASWRSYSAALGQGLSVDPGANLATNTVAPKPDPPVGVGSMLSSELWRTGNIGINQSLPNGGYQVYIWVMEDFQAGFRSFHVNLEGTTATTVSTGTVGSWHRYGPLPVTVSDGTLDLDLIRIFGDTLIQGFAVYSDSTAASTFRVNLNGSSTTIDGRPWHSHGDALHAGMTVGPANYAVNAVGPNPAAPAGVTAMLSTELWRTGDLNLSVPVPNGAYDVYLWVMEDYRAGYRSFDVRLESAYATTVSTGAVGTWQRYGPLPVTVSDGRASIDLIQLYGDTLIQGLAVVPRGQPA
ncbi:nucleoside hydrolase [Micromonospora sp. CPCC 205561]|uniref:nucleoside hydrolase n=1 Tax=Micromonospora sp. CPCC 205561 TaxID=3122407 RepID=UPI002FF13908